MSPRAQTKTNRLMKEIVDMQLDNKWKGTCEQFILSFKKKLQKLDDMQNPADRISEKMQRILLQNAIEQIPSLKHVSSTDAYQRILALSVRADCSTARRQGKVAVPTVRTPRATF